MASLSLHGVSTAPCLYATFIFVLSGVLTDVIWRLPLASAERYTDDSYNYYSNYNNNQENYAGSEYLSDWNNQDWVKLSGRIQPPKCVDIPANLTLCYGIGYQQMMLPNLLDHDSLSEVTQQAASWVPLTRINCHPDAKMFLCSLFSPVCLDRLIYPCRSLCQAVQASCVGRMKAYGFDWPDMLKCDRFPLDNDLCIRPIHDVKPDNNCTACKHPLTHESMIDQFCRSDVAMRVSVKEYKNVNGHKELVLRKKKTLFKQQGFNKNQLRNLKPVIEGGASCSCETINSTEDRYLLMGNKRADQLVITFGMVWNRKDKEFRKGINAIRKANTCEGIIRELSANGIENKPLPSGKVDKPKTKSEKKDVKGDKKNKTVNKDKKGKTDNKDKKGKTDNKDKKGKTDNKDKKTTGRKGKKGKKGKGKKNKNKKEQSSPNSATRRERVSELEDRALSNFMKAAN